MEISRKNTKRDVVNQKTEKERQNGRKKRLEGKTERKKTRGN